MGKGTILSEYGDGRYRVAINYERQKLAAMLDAIYDEIVAFNASLADLMRLVDIAELARDDAWRDVDFAILAFKHDPTPGNKTAVDETQRLALAKQLAFDAARANYDREKLSKASVEKRMAELQSAMPDEDPEADVWCADYNEGLTGVVGLIEPDRTRGFAAPIIYPAGESGAGAGYAPTRDGGLVPPAMMTAEAALYNVAILPGAEKWKPLYRKGEISNLAGNLATVMLDPLVSTEQRLDVNQGGIVSAPIEYMSCHEAVFEVGDRVVVAFVGQDWSQPKVIGFEANPRQCARDLCIVYVRREGTLLQPFYGKILRVRVRDMVVVSDTQFCLVAYQTRVSIGQFTEGVFWSARNSGTGQYLEDYVTILRDSAISHYIYPGIGATTYGYYGYTTQNGYAALGAHAGLTYVIYAFDVYQEYWEYAGAPKRYHFESETQFAIYNYGTLVSKVTLQLTELDGLSDVNYPYDMPYAARVYKRAYEMMASQNGVICCLGDKFSGSESYQYSVVVFSLAGALLYTLDNNINVPGGQLPNDVAQISASKYHYVIFYPATNQCKVFGVDGVLVMTFAPTVIPAPTPPANFGTGVIYNVRLCSDDVSISFVHSWHYTREWFVPPIAYDQADIIVDRYTVSPGGLVAHDETEAVFRRNYVGKVLQARPYN